MKKIIFPILILISIFYSCETITEIDIEPHEARMVPYCLSGNLEESTIVYLSKSQGILNEEELELIGDAEMSLKKNGELICDFYSPFNGGNYSTDAFYLFDEELAEYEMEIRHNDFGIISAKQILPKIPIVQSATYEQVGQYDPLMDSDYDKMEFTFSDPSETEDYYHVQGFIRNKTGAQEFYSLWTWTDSPLLEETVSSVGLIFDDQSFNGNEISITLKVDDTFIDLNQHDLYVKLSRITEDMYKYQRSRKTYDDAEYNPFAEPVTLHSNFSSGYGIFALQADNMYFIQ